MAIQEVLPGILSEKDEKIHKAEIEFGASDHSYQIAKKKRDEAQTELVFLMEEKGVGTYMVGPVKIELVESKRAKVHIANEVV